jgi:methionine synthase I (cobalamin-dependent)
MILDKKLGKQDIIVLDGAIGSEIARLGGAMDSAAWCAIANKTHPEVVRRVHEEYIRAGADVVTANTFANCRHVLAGSGLADETVGITTRAVELAREAVNEVAPDRPVAVAGSMSNTRAWIPGTFSPDPRFLPTPAEEAANYREMAETLATAGVDLILMEMMRDIDHASMVTAAAVETGCRCGSASVALCSPMAAPVLGTCIRRSRPISLPMITRGWRSNPSRRSSRR